MSKISFIEAKFFSNDDTLVTLERRLQRHLRMLRSSAEATPISLEPVFETNDQLQETTYGHPGNDKDRGKIKRRAGLIIARRQTASCVGHLSKEEQNRLATVGGGVALVVIETEQKADEIAANLHDEMPWMAPATEHVWRAMRRSIRKGLPGLRMPPLLLSGPAGIGKSHWARRFGSLISAPTAVVEATGENASFGVVGSQRGWGSACPGRPLETIIQSGIGNPVIVVDEIEKAGLAVSTRGQAHGLQEGLLPLLEPMTASRWSCPYYQVKFDMSWILWVLTSNDSGRLSAPFLSRCPPLKLRNLTAAELTHFITREATNNCISADAAGVVIEVLGHAAKHGLNPDLRLALRLLAFVDDLEDMPTRH